MALGCVLVVLFPVVSATDDLHAMRAEMEESPISKRSISQKSGDKPSPWKSHNQSALIFAAISLAPLDGGWNPIPTVYFPSRASSITRQPTRAPPLLHTA